MSAVQSVDLTAFEALTEFQQDRRARGIELHLAEFKTPVQDHLLRTDLWKCPGVRAQLSGNEALESLLATGPKGTLHL